MFNINFDYGMRGVAYYNDQNKLIYNPPVFEQRYNAVLRCLQLPRWSGHLKKIVEFGCAEMRLLVFLKSIPGVEHIVQVDIDEHKLDCNLYKAEPLMSDYFSTRENELQIDVYCGSVDTPNDCLLNTDVFIGIELIEHLDPETLEKMPYNIFGFMKPKMAIFTTPNAESNVLFDMQDKFRHPDHKFEWTREQFKDWGHSICARFPEYKVSFYGVAPGPEGTEHLGCCSQLALFIRDDFLQLTSSEEEDMKSSDGRNLPTEKVPIKQTIETDNIDESVNDNTSNERTPSDDVAMKSITKDLAETHIDKGEYRLLRTVNYVENVDHRTREEKIYHEASFHLSSYMNTDNENYDPDSETILIPLQRIFNLVYKFTTDIDEFKHVMRLNNYSIDDNDVFHIKIAESQSESEYEDEYHDSYQPITAGGQDESGDDWD